MLDKLIYEEITLASVQLLKVTHNIDNRVTEVDEGVRRVYENVQVVKREVALVNDNIKAVDDKVQTTADGRQFLFSESSASSLTLLPRRQGNRKGSEGNRSTNSRRNRQHKAFVIRQSPLTVQFLTKIAGNQLLESLRKWQSPPDPSTDHHIAGGRQHTGTAEWFIESDKCHKWKAAGSLLWIHGKRTFLLTVALVILWTTCFAAGSGKSILWSVAPPICIFGKLSIAV
jgi:hypothetical protein